MDDDASSPISMFGSFSGNNLDYDLMDELLDNGYWLETTEESNFSLLEPNVHDFNPTPYQQNYGQGVEISDFDETPLLHNSQTVDFSKNQSRNREVILAKSYSDQSENIMVESTEPNKRLWIAPNPTSYVSVKSRLMRAIDCLAKLTNDSDVLIQIWVPIKREGRQFLTTDDQPFFYNEKSTSLAIYRDVSKKYSFPAEKDSKDFIGLPGRVFLKKSPEWTPDVRFFKIEEYPRVHHAHQCNVSGSLALPVFEQESGICLGVVEIITTTQTMNYRPEIENICKALEAVDLRSSEISCPPSWKGCDDSYQIVLNEIQHVLKFVCDAHDLPLAQSWALCVQQGTSECMRSNKIQALCISTIDSVCYLRDERVRPFHEACSQHCLHIGEGTVGEAFATNQPCFATDIAAFSKTDYPLSHYAKMFHLHGSVAIRLRSIYTGLADFVLEFFLPSDCEDVDEQLRILGQISSGLQLVCKSLRVLTGDEVERENIDFINETYVKKREINIEDTEGKSKNVDLSLEHKEGELEVFEENPQAVNEEIYPNFGSKRSGESGEYFFANAGKKSGEKRRAKSEKNISLEVLRQYFAGSLKDAAKSIGVCPTTLKRICRQHGITRWPSRKIKKVGHSLRKLQLVIDSVQGVEGTIQLNSFYSKFPELSTTKMPTTSSAPQLEARFFKPFSTKLEAGVLSPNTTTSKSSGSQSSGSSFSTEEKPTLVTSPLAEQPPLRALSETELHENGQEKTKLLVRSKSDKILPMENRNFKEDGGFHVKVTFGEEKIRLFLQRNWGFGDVKNEILRRFRIDENGKVDLKYLDDDDEWVLLTCDADLEECIDIHKSTKSRTIKITVHQGPNSNLFGSFGSSS